MDARGSDNPIISIIITSYNYAHYLGEAVTSVLSQDFQNLELIVIDNASTDATDDVIAGFSEDPRLRYIKNETNIGLTPNHIRGLTFARGEYVVFLSADDRLLPGHLRRTYDFLQAHPETDLVYTGVVFINADSWPYDVRNMTGQLPVDYNGGRNEFAALLAEGCYIAMPSMLVRRSLYEELGTFENIRGADWEITARWAAARKRFAYLRSASVAIRLHAPQASGKSYLTDGGDLLDYLTILEKFVVPENLDQLQGFKVSIARQVDWRAKFFLETNGQDPSPEALGRIDAIKQLLSELKVLPATQYLADRPLISVVMRVGTVWQLMFSLQSLAMQQEAPPWEAVIVGESGPDFEPLLRSRAYADRVRFVRLDDSAAPAEARNTGIRLASARIITYLEPGNTFGPLHLANLERAFATGAHAVRSSARLLIVDTADGTPNTTIRQTPVAGIFRGMEDDDRDLVAANVPLDSIAHTTDVVDRVGRFRPELATAETWDFWLRVRQFNVAFNGAGAIDVRIVRQQVLPPRSYLTVTQSLYRLFGAPADGPVAARRAAYLETATALIEGGAEGIGNEMQAIQVLARLYGIQNVAAAPVAG